MTCKKIRNLLCHALVPAVLAVLMVPAIAYAEEPCRVSIPVEVTVTGNQIPHDRRGKGSLWGNRISCAW